MQGVQIHVTGHRRNGSAAAPLSAVLIGATIGAVVAGGVAVGLAAAGKIDSFWEGAGFALAGAVIGGSAVGAFLAAGGRGKYRLDGVCL